MDGEQIALLIFGAAIVSGMAATAWWVHSYGMSRLNDALAEAKSAASWSRTLGKVTVSVVRDRTYGRHRHKVVKAVPIIAYLYEVDGRIYGGDRILFGVVEFNLQKNARKLTDRYPEGAVVPVLYDPRYPQRSVLEPRVHMPGQKWVFRGVALFLTACGLFIGGPMIWVALTTF
jgi:hypothetical protein